MMQKVALKADRVDERGGGMCKDPTMKVKWQAGAKEIDNTFKYLGV
jgi:hypothetical protein